jgi:DNA-binding Xre family transcriptional regulator
MMSESKETPRYGWRLAALMGEHRIRTSTELQRRLQDTGYEVTSSQLTRIVYNRPMQIKTALLDALGEVFGCTMNDLMPLLDPAQRKPDQGMPAPKERKKRVRASRGAAATASEEDMAGPVVRPFPIPKK